MPDTGGLDEELLDLRRFSTTSPYMSLKEWKTVFIAKVHAVKSHYNELRAKSGHRKYSSA